MTTPTRTEGDRFLDNCGRIWTVDEHGGILRRSWHSLDACAGPLQPVHDEPQPGDKYRDREDETWTVLESGMLRWDQSPRSLSPLVMAFEAVNDMYGPLTKIEPGEDRPSNVVELHADDDADPVNHPSHYKAGGMEAIDVIDAFFLHDAHLANVFKYIARAGKKGDATECLMKAAWYLDRAIERRHTDAA